MSAPVLTRPAHIPSVETASSRIIPGVPMPSVRSSGAIRRTSPAIVRPPLVTRGGERTSHRFGPAQLRQPPLEQAPLGVVVDERQRSLECITGLFRSAESPQQLGPRRVQVAVIVEGKAID